MVFRKINVENFSRRSESTVRGQIRIVFSKSETSLRQKLIKVQNQAEDGRMYLKII